uniref:Uncharacterized protein n=1 Tax=Candidatus Nitrotoga fabula TaxID=2182327 RepID=A0A2X0QV49_9PROT|nr:protein of unknown function [Candidatus Nitrotoga fabula]
MPINVARPILWESRKTELRTRQSAVNEDDMKPPDSNEQHRPRKTRDDDGLSDLES